MEKLSMDALAARLELLERANRRWKCLAGFMTLSLALSLAIGSHLGSRVAAAQQPEKVDQPLPRRMEYKVTNLSYLHQIEKSLPDMAAEGWELVQVVPTEWTTSGQGQSGRFQTGIMVTRRVTVAGK